MALCGLCAPAAAQGPPVLPWGKPVTMTVRDAPLVDVLRRLFEGVDARYAPTPEARRLIATRKVPFTATSLPLRKALLLALEGAGSRGGKRLIVWFERKRCPILVQDIHPHPTRSIGPPASRDPGRRPITYVGRNITVLQAVSAVLWRASTGTRIEPTLKERMAAKRVTVSFHREELDAALSRLVSTVQQNGYRIASWYDQDRDYYVLYREREPVPVEVSALPVSLLANDRESGEAMERMLSSASIAFAYDVDMLRGRQVSAGIEKEPALEGVARLLRAAGLEGQLEATEAGSVISIHRPNSPDNAEVGERRVTARFRNTDIRYALKSLFRVANWNYVLVPDLCGTVTVDITGLTVADAIDRVLARFDGPLPIRYQIENGIYYFDYGRDYANWK
jgi:hypothetical protein